MSANTSTQNLPKFIKLVLFGFIFLQNRQTPYQISIIRVFVLGYLRASALLRHKFPQCVGYGRGRHGAAAESVQRPPSGPQRHCLLDATPADLLHGY